MLYCKPEADRVVYPVTKTDAILDNPGVSFPRDITDEVMAFLGYLPVEPAPEPTAAPGHRVRRGTPVLVGAVWTEVWEQVPLTPEELAQAEQALQRGIVDAVQARLDDFAKTRNYDSILSACTYATSTVPKFQAEGQYAVNARDLTWATLYEMLAEVQAGTRPVPSGYADIEPSLPALSWPA